MDEEKPHSISSIATRIVCMLLGVLVLYPLSFGPAAYLWTQQPSMYPAMMDFYHPLLMATYNTRFHDPLYGYMWWWEKLAPPKTPRHKKKRVRFDPPHQSHSAPQTTPPPP